MKLFIVAALVSVASAARLEHLERGYLPPDHSHGQASFGSQGQFGSQGSFGSASQGFESNAIDSAATRSQGISASFPGATSNQYLPPNHGSSGSNGQFTGSLSGFQGSHQAFGSQYPNQFGSASNGFQQPQARYQQPQTRYQQPQTRYQQPQTQYQQQYSNQFPATNRQYLAPKSSIQDIPQQAFDEQTGYHY